MTNQNLVTTILEVLRNPEIWKINFELNGLIVTGERFAQVAAAIQMGMISCIPVGRSALQQDKNLEEGSYTEALYDPHANTIQFPSQNYAKSSEYEKTVIVHEATHAMFDFFAKSDDDRVLGIDDESAAVLAQALYIRICDLGTAAARFGMEEKGAGQNAFKLAERMMKERDDFKKDRRIYVLKPNQITDFRAAVARQWKLVKDGNSDRSGVQVIYDGVTCSRFESGSSKAGASLRSGTKVN